MKPERNNTNNIGLEKLLTLFQTLAAKENRAKLAVAFGGIAMVLILLSELVPSAPKAATSVETTTDPTAYRIRLEQQLTAFIEQIDGAGKTVVMLTLENGEETVYALDTQSGQTQSQETHVLLDDGSALAQTVYLPKICGAAIVCEGGGDVRVAARITELVSALLDLPSNRICVERRKG